jgi:hypothetical protein
MCLIQQTFHFNGESLKTSVLHFKQNLIPSLDSDIRTIAVQQPGLEFADLS